jgi:hypothetical protein
MASQYQYDISVVITLHAEGRLAHRTLKALQATIEHARTRGVTTEIVAVMDKVRDPILQNTIAHWEELFKGRLSVQACEFGALSLSRNFGVAKSNGEFVSILDGDDLYGESWLYNAYQVCSADPKAIAHPVAYFSFPFEPFLRYLNQDDLTFLDLLSTNKWPALLMARRDIFQAIPYIKDDQTYAYQDWLWNCETVSQGYHHVLAPETIMAIRQKRQGRSLWQNSSALNKVVRPNSLFRKFFTNQFAFERQKLETRHQGNPLRAHIRRQLAPWGKAGLDHLQIKHPVLLENIIRLKRLAFSAFQKLSPSDHYSGWINSELSKLADLEPTLKDFTAAQIRSAPNTFCHFLAIDASMTKMIEASGARVYVTDALENQIATYNLLMHLHAAGGDGYVITTRRSDNAWKKFLPENLVHVDIGNCNLMTEEKLRLMHRLVLEAEIEYLHLFGSQLGMEMIDRYPGTFEKIKVLLSVTEAEISSPASAVSNKINLCDDVLDCFSKISADTYRLAKHLKMQYGLFDLRVEHHGYPFNPKVATPLLHANEIRLRSYRTNTKGVTGINILWIGKQKASAYKKTMAALSPSLNLMHGNVTTARLVWPGLAVQKSPGVFAPLRDRFERMARFIGIGKILFDAVIFENFRPSMLPLLTQCIGLGLPVIVLTGEVPEQIRIEGRLRIVDNATDPESVKTAVMDMFAQGNQAAQSMLPYGDWDDFKQQVAAFYN